MLIIIVLLDVKYKRSLLFRKGKKRIQGMKKQLHFNGYVLMYIVDN